MCSADSLVREKHAATTVLELEIVAAKPKGKSNGSEQECPLYTG